MGYAVKEIFYTLQGEGLNAGRAAMFCRFAGCNLWSGREADRQNARCRFCDTDFVGTDGAGGGTFADAQALANVIARHWPGGGRRLVVFTGGEPCLQLDGALTRAMHDRGFEVAVETNGTVPPPPGLDWVCVSPKAGTDLVVISGDELKFVYPQPGAAPEDYAGLDFRHFLLQPMDGPRRRENMASAARYCLEHPHWRLSLQTHKVVGLP
ncbi:MAG: 7-carboxy-7-deazaguanine synthase [Rhodospirillales bacterium]|nr:7-carboxy-7-deazaguanine synthase [Rhodospirillales bacterium]